MHAERDYLVKRVFPELADWCERRKRRLVDVDLRWGVTEADATEHPFRADRERHLPRSRPRSGGWASAMGVPGADLFGGVGPAG